MFLPPYYVDCQPVICILSVLADLLSPSVQNNRNNQLVSRYALPVTPLYSKKIFEYGEYVF